MESEIHGIKKKDPTQKNTMVLILPPVLIIKNKIMKNKIFHTLAAVVSSAGSIFAYADSSKTDTKKNCTEKCRLSAVITMRELVLERLR